MKKIYIIALALLCGASVYGQSEVGIRYSADTGKRNKQVVTNVEMDMSHMHLRKQEMVTVTPVISSNDSDMEASGAPVIIAGNKRYKELRRTRYFDNANLEQEPVDIVRYKKKKAHDRSFSYSTDYEPWMRDASLVINEKVSGCTRCKVVENNILMTRHILPPAFVPEYKVAYVTPPAEAVKQRSETFVSHVNYEVGKSTLLRNYKNNAKVLDEVDVIVKELTGNKDLKVSSFSVAGYASPEGNANSNLTLSQNRAKSFLNYLKDNHGFNVNNVRYDGKGEDWEGLYKAVEASGIADRDKVLSIIRDTPDVNKRKQALQNLSGGRTYRVLLNDFYPPLRRNEYEISYVARAFDIEEAREIIYTKPQLLSLNEMFLVANSYPKDSKEFKEVFDIAARMYPGDKYAMMNNAALEVESGAYDMAIKRLSEVSDPDALNNVGVAYTYKGDLAKAEEYFRKAADGGSETGLYNLDQLGKARE